MGQGLGVRVWGSGFQDLEVMRRPGAPEFEESTWVGIWWLGIGVQGPIWHLWSRFIVEGLTT